MLVSLNRTDFMKKIAITLVIALVGCIGIFSNAFAYKTIDASTNFLGNAVKPTGLSTDNIQTSTGRFIQAALLLVGTVFLGLMIYGGFTWMTARGEEDKITKAKETIIAASIGIAIILGAYAATTFITENLISRTSGGPGQACGDSLTSCLANCSNSAGPNDAARAACQQACDSSFNYCIQQANN